MKKNDFPTEILEVRVDHINGKGQGVVFYKHPAAPGNTPKGLTLFLSNVVPGDLIRVSVPNAKGRRRAHLNEFELLEASPDRNLENPIKPTIAGGTPLQYMNYDAQLEYKENLVTSYLETENFNTQLVQPIIGMENPDYYRNKVDLTFGPNGELGMHQQGNFKNIIDLEESLIMPKIMVKIKKVVSKWQQDHDLKGYDKEAHAGLLRQLMMRQSSATGEVMVILFAMKSPADLQDETKDLVERLTSLFEDVVSIHWILNTDLSDQMVTEEKYVLYGRDYINEELNGFHYKLYFDTFFQANSGQAEQMIDTALEMTGMTKEMRILDLFCGIGTFSLPFAQAAKELIGIELVEQSIVSAKENASKAGLTNTHFFTSDAREGLEKLKETWPTPGVLILNPPRSGAGGKMMRSIGRYGSDKIVYISCNPKTLADDLKWLREFGYEFKGAQPIDQFPHTVHVETVVLMSKTDK